MDKILDFLSRLDLLWAQEPVVQAGSMLLDKLYQTN